MNKLNIPQFCFALAIALTIVISIPAWSLSDSGQSTTTTTEPASDNSKSDDNSKPDKWFIYSVIFVVLSGCIVTPLLIRKDVSNSTWSISDALSEEVEVTALKEDGKTPVIDEESKKPLLKKVMCASSSRLVALMGMIVIVMMFVGFGTFSLYKFAIGEELKDIDNVKDFLFAGLTLFAPYIVNKFSNIFGSLSPKK